mgnify:FL=1
MKTRAFYEIVLAYLSIDKFYRPPFPCDVIVLLFTLLLPPIWQILLQLHLWQNCIKPVYFRVLFSEGVSTLK